jgi:hypothetical protein
VTLTPLIEVDPGNDGGLLAWVESGSGTAVSLNGIWGQRTNDMWIVGDAGTTLHWNGNQWSPMPTQTTERLTGVWGAASDDVWAIGDHGTLLHWVLAWTGSTFPNGQSFSRLFGISLGNPKMWAVGGNAAAHFDSTWSTMAIDTPAATGVWVDSEDNPWVVGGSDLLHRVATWSKTSGSASDRYNAIWGSANDDLWVVGGGCKIWHWQGKGLSPVASNATCQTLTAIWGAGPNDLWAVGSEATILHWTGSSWSRVSTPVSSPQFNAVWGTGPRDIWVVGTGGTILHYN